jgi:Tfp pilus assembly protein PilF
MDACRRWLRRGFLAFVGGGAICCSTGCALVPSLDDIHSSTKFVKDTITGKAKRDKQNQMFAEARILERRQDFIGAEKLYRELLTSKPDSRDCYHRLAVMASQQGRYDEAMNLYQTALRLGDPTPDLWNDIGYCHYLQHQLPEAQGALQQALTMLPQHRSALNNMGLVVGEQGQIDEAYKLFRQANSEAEAEANTGYLCAQLGDYHRAQQHYSRALSCDPTMRTATDALIQVTQRIQMIEDRQAQLASGIDPNQPGAVRPASHETSDAPPRRKHIEVFTASPPRHGYPVQQAAAAANAQRPPQGAINPPAIGQTSPAAALVGGVPQGAQQPYSYQQQARPEYLQPRSQAAVAAHPLSGTAPPQTGYDPSGAQSGGAPAGGAVMSAAGPYPPLVGGASAVR